MAMGSEGKMQGIFKVTIKKKEMVTAVLPMQEHKLPLSNLDLLLPPVDVGVFFCYKKPLNMADKCISSILKKAMAQVLVSYYPFAGEIVPNSSGEPEILCNNRGVEFFEAFADIEMKQFNLYNPDECIEGKLVPQKQNGVFAVQVTELKCGGIVVACTFDHRIADAYSANMFLVSWAEAAHSKPLSILPSFKRSLLNPSHSACFDSSLDEMYVPISKLQPPKNPELDADDLISRIYYVKSNQLNKLQSFASDTECKRTKLEAFTAFLWQMIAKSARKKGHAYGSKMTKVGIVVDGRSRLSKVKMTTYFGNVLSIPFGEKKVNDLIENSLSSIANEIHDFLDCAVTKKHFLGLIDWVESHRPEPALAKVYSSGNDDGPAFVVSSGQRFPVSKMDFGWGFPAFGSYHFPWGGNAGYVMPMPTPKENGDWIVYMHLLKGQIELIEAEAAEFFRPLTCDYLNLIN